MFSFNQTGEWLQNVPSNETINLLNEARMKRKSLKDKFRSRCKEIENKRKLALQEKQEAIRKIKENVYKKKEKQTSDMLYYGLWQNVSMVDEMLQSISNISDKRKALISQLRFRQNVLTQFSKDKTIFNAYSKGKAFKYRSVNKKCQETDCGCFKQMC
jgi:hypothetical protein